MTHPLARMAHAIRFLSLDAVERAQSGHPGMPMGMADVATVLFSQFLSVSPEHPHWMNRDRFVLSAGHGSMLLYSVYHLLGYPQLSMDALKNFRQLGSATPGHPEYGHTLGVETTTGPLGQGLANAVGMALSEAMLSARFPDFIDHYTYALVGDGCLMEGISQEAISLAGHLALKKLIVLWDDNRITIDGATSISTSDDQLKRFQASGWDTITVDAYDHDAIAKAIAWAKSTPRPVLIACHSIIGYGAPHKQGTHGVHGAPLGRDEADATRTHLQWSYPPFVIPDDIYAFWHDVAEKNTHSVAQWEERIRSHPQYADFLAFMEKTPPAPDAAALCTLAARVADSSMATRDASLKVLEVLFSLYPNLLGGCADLNASVKTHPKGVYPVTSPDFLGAHLDYGVREHGMAAVMNGIALHGGFRPFGGTFLVFADYMRPAIRLASLMHLPVTYVLSHDSIGVGEDGPTHQPFETLSSLRVFPNIHVFRPMDFVETLECWLLALHSKTTPCVLALSRQSLPALRHSYDPHDNRSALGAYTLVDTETPPDCCILASGSEVSLAMEVRALLMPLGFSVRVLSVPCLDIFAKSSPTYHDALLPPSALRCVIEAGSRQSWDFLLQKSSLFFGVETFGASAPIDAIFQHVGLMPKPIADAIERRLGEKRS